VQYGYSNGEYFVIVGIAITICGMLSIIYRKKSKKNNVLSKIFMTYAGTSITIIGLLMITYGFALINKYILPGTKVDLYIQIFIVSINIILFFLLMAWYKKHTQEK